ncbi:MAG: hypothetical protein M0Q98_06475 [Pseudomonas sp.]|nr:hypothetical protein [Pseudomonas sp.]
MQTTDQAHQQMMLALRAQARKQPWLTLSFALIVVTIVVLIFVSIYQDR